MPHPLITMHKLNEVELELNMVQSWIDNARIAAPTNQVVQLELDRQQTDIDQQRAQVAWARLDIASRN